MNETPNPMSDEEKDAAYMDTVQPLLSPDNFEELVQRIDEFLPVIATEKWRASYNDLKGLAYSFLSLKAASEGRTAESETLKDLAIDACKQAMRVASFGCHSCVRLARLYLSRGQAAEALDCLESALASLESPEVAPDAKPSVVRALLGFKGASLVILGDPDLGAQFLTEVNSEKFSEAGPWLEPLHWIAKNKVMVERPLLDRLLAQAQAIPTDKPEAIERILKEFEYLM